MDAKKKKKKQHDNAPAVASVLKTRVIKKELKKKPKKNKLTHLHPSGSLYRSTEVAPCLSSSFYWKSRIKKAKRGNERTMFTWTFNSVVTRNLYFV